MPNLHTAQTRALLWCVPRAIDDASVAGDADALRRWLDRIVSKMPRAADARVDSYLAVLEIAMIDGVLAEHENKELTLHADLTRGQVPNIHGDHLGAIAEVALEDGVVTLAERATLNQAAMLLGLRARRPPAVNRPDARWRRPRYPFKPGDRVMFTGDSGRATPVRC